MHSIPGDESDVHQRPVGNKSRAQRVEDLVVEYLRQRESGKNPEFGDVCRAEPDLESDVRTAVLALGEIGLDVPAEEGEETRIGPYRLVRRLGGGGMGIVYLAEGDADGLFFAVKIIRPDFAVFDKARLRFSREVQAVSRLSHPGIVPILDMGEAREVPYLVMPFIDGANLADVLRKVPVHEPESLTAHDLLETVSDATEGDWHDACLDVAHQLADAVAHAHARGVLHRDLKPSNIMLTPDGRALLLDFGLAHAEGATPLTRTGALLGSEPYMAPEQLDGETVGEPRSDVYALGVILYEMLTLQSPFATPTPRRTRHLVRRGGAPPVRTLNGSVPRDVETICMKAFDVDRRKRYTGAAELAEDLRRARNGETILGRPLSYRTRGLRTLRAHPKLSILTAVGILMVGGSLAFGIQMRSLKIQAGRAQDEQLRSVDQGEYLASWTRSMFADLSPEERRAKLDQLLSVTAGVGAMSPTASAVRRATAGSILTRLRFTDDAEAHLLEAIKGFEDVGDEARAPLAHSLILLAQNRVEAGRGPKAMEPLERAMAILEEDAPDDLGRISAVLHTRARALLRTARLIYALEMADQALSMRRAWYGEVRLPVVETLGARANLLTRLGDTRAALRTIDEAESIARRITDDPALPAAVIPLQARSFLHIHLGNHREAVDTYEQLLAIQLDVAGPLSLQVADTRVNLALALQFLERREEAYQQYEAVLATIDRGHEHWYRSEINAASCLAGLGRIEEADARYRDLLEGATKFNRRVVNHLIARMHHRAGNLDRATQSYELYIEGCRSPRLQTDARRAHGLINLGLIAKESGDDVTAQEYFETSRDLFERLLDEFRDRFAIDHLALAEAEEEQAQFFLVIEDWAAATEALQACLERRLRLHSPQHWSVAELQAELGLAIAMLGRTVEGEQLMTSGYATLEDRLGSGHRRTRRVARHLARVLTDAGRTEDATLWITRRGDPMRTVFTSSQP
jgi:serine/threonine protein kinase